MTKDRDDVWGKIITALAINEHDFSKAIFPIDYDTIKGLDCLKNSKTTDKEIRNLFGDTDRSKLP